LALAKGEFARARADFERALGLKDWEPEGRWGLHRVAAARGHRAEAAAQLEAYRRAVRARDRALAREAAAGLERPSPYEPGLPLSSSGRPLAVSAPMGER
jgi:Tfp pilus assembly protein PilF